MSSAPAFIWNAVQQYPQVTPIKNLKHKSAVPPVAMYMSTELIGMSGFSICEMCVICG